jgi:rod shape-determining protein MreD
MAVTAKDINPQTGGEVGFKRAAAIVGVVILALVVQSTLLAKATLLGVIPQLVLVVVVSVAYLDGDRVGVASGFIGGLLQDLLLPGSIAGLTALVYTLIGYSVGRVRQLTTAETVWVPVAAVAGASALAEIGYAALAISLGQEWVSLGFTLQVTGLVVLYNTLLTPFVYPLVRKVADRFRPERVYRW